MMPPADDLTWWAFPLADESAGGSEMWCDTEQHPEKFEPPARWLEMLARVEGGVLTVYKAWTTCPPCHDIMRETYKPSVDVPRETKGAP